MAGHSRRRVLCDAADVPGFVECRDQHGNAEGCDEPTLHQDGVS
jgi:hypothetical protein